MAADATLATLDHFENPDLWEIRDGVPIFDAHEERDAGGVLLRKFDLADLEEIAGNCNRREIETGNAVPLMLGHTRSDAPETEQPPIVGYARRFRVGKFGPQQRMCILATFYYFKDKFEELELHRQFPHRSVELWIRDKIFDPIALLKRTPKRDLGLLTYEAQHQRLLYAMESVMSDRMECPDSTVMVPHPYPGFEHTDHTEPVVDRVMKYMAGHPIWQYAHKCYQAGMSGPGFASGSSTFIPGMGMGRIPMQKDEKEVVKDVKVDVKGAVEKERQEKVQHDIELAQYQRDNEALKQSNDALLGRVAALEKQTRLARYERDLGHLISEGYKMELAEEMKEVDDYAPEQFVRHVERIKKRYQRAPVGKQFIPVAGVAHEGGERPESEEDVTAAQAAKAVTLTTRQGSEFFGKYDEALKFVRTKK